MNQEQIMLFNQYVKMGEIPILLEDVPLSAFHDVVILESDCSVTLLNGHYEGADFVAPDWYLELLRYGEGRQPVLLIHDINKIPPIDQTKFIEILKYKKVSTFNLPKNCIIVVTCSNLKESPLNEEIYSLVAHI